MTRIAKQDDYLPLYAYQKARHPEHPIYLRSFRKQDVDDVDKLLEISKGNRDVVKTEEDWNVLANLVVFFIQRWNDEWIQFKETIPEIRETRRSRGYSESKEILYLAALPPRLERLIKVIFPYQQFNKKFMYQFIKRFKIFRIAGEGN